jgi:hypothetical protein
MVITMPKTKTELEEEIKQLDSETNRISAKIVELIELEKELDIRILSKQRTLDAYSVTLAEQIEKWDKLHADLGRESSILTQLRNERKDLSDAKTGRLALLLYIRQHYQREIQRGEHSNKEWWQVITGYLDRERGIVKQETWWKRWRRLRELKRNERERVWNPSKEPRLGSGDAAREAFEAQEEERLLGAGFLDKTQREKEG